MLYYEHVTTLPSLILFCEIPAAKELDWSSWMKTMLENLFFRDIVVKNDESLEWTGTAIKPAYR